MFGYRYKLPDISNPYLDPERRAMKNLAKVRDENEGAFTLIELLVVILIIGILAAIAIPMFLNQRKAAVDSSVESDVKNAASQIETWSVSNPNKAIPSFTVPNGGAPTGTDIDGSLVDIKAGEGTTLTVAPIAGGDTGSYTIVGTNKDGNRAVADDGNDDTEDGIRFDSTAGGLQ